MYCDSLDVSIGGDDNTQPALEFAIRRIIFKITHCCSYSCMVVTVDAYQVVSMMIFGLRVCNNC